MVFYCNVYYTILLAWALHYLFFSFQSPLPWATCGNWWNSDGCITYNGSIAEGIVVADVNKSSSVADSVVEYWE